MDYKKKNKNFFKMSAILFTIKLFSTAIGATKYDDSQILKLLDNHIKTNNKITKLGANIYTEKTKRIFQLEISSTKDEANKILIQAFSVLFKLSAYTKKQIHKCKLIIHLENYDIPIIATCDYKCSEKYFLSDKLKEWRDNCLIIRTI